MTNRVTISALVLTFALPAGGCIWNTTRSSAGPFVTDVGFVGERLYVRDCYVDLEVTETWDFINMNHNKSSEISAYECGEHLYALPAGLEGVAAAPPATTGDPRTRRPRPETKPRTIFTPEQRRACALPLAEWRQLPDDERARTFATLPADCRRMVGEPGQPR